MSSITCCFQHISECLPDYIGKFHVSIEWEVLVTFVTLGLHTV